MNDEIIVCFDCRKAIKLTEYDNYPEYNVEDEGNYIEEIEKDDRTEFNEKHHGHNISLLKILEGEILSRGYFSEPMNESIIKATDGAKNYYIRSWRENSADKMEYELVKENIMVRMEHIGFDSNEFLESLDRILMKEKLERTLKDKIMDVVNKNMNSMEENLEKVSDYDLKSDKEIAVASNVWKEKVLYEVNNVIRSEEDKKIKEIIRKKLDDIQYEIIPCIDVPKDK